MNPWILIAVSLLVLYGLLLLLGQVFLVIETYHAARREERTRAADPRNNGGELVRSRGQ